MQIKKTEIAVVDVVCPSITRNNIYKKYFKKLLLILPKIKKNEGRITYIIALGSCESPDTTGNPPISE
jgi:hypothetical protein